MADYSIPQNHSVPEAMETRYKDMGNGSHAEVFAISPARPGEPIEVYLSLDTNAYSANDVLAGTQEVANFAEPGGSRFVTNLVVIDKDDQGAEMDIIFFDTNVYLGAENSAPSITDADAQHVRAIVHVLSGDYIDLGGVKVASIALTTGDSGLGFMLKAAENASSVYLGAITRGTPTHTVLGIVLEIGVAEA